jgi:hypothetical protein
VFEGAIHSSGRWPNGCVAPTNGCVLGAEVLTRITMSAMTHVGKEEPPPPLLGLLLVLPLSGLLFELGLLSPLLLLGEVPLGELPPLLPVLLAVTIVV